MNIQLLLSGTQSQGSFAPSEQSSSSALASFQGIFRQSLSQAANAPSRSNDPSTASAEPIATLAQQLQDLGIDIGADDLASLLAQLSLAEDEAMSSQLALHMPINETMTPLQEIAERLKLVAAFSETTVAEDSLVAAPTLESIAQQLSISEEKAADLLSALDQLIDPTEGEFASISGALSALLAPLQGDNKQVASAPVESFRHALSSLAPNVQADSDTAPSRSLAASAPMTGSQLSLQANAQEAMTAQVFLTPPGHRDVATGLEDLASMRPNPLAAGFQSAPTAGQTSTPLMPFISTPVTSPAWPSQLGQQLVQFTQRGGEQQVQMQLHPAELGPLSITLKVTEQGTQAHFLSAHAQVRQVIEHAIPQLRETLAEQGISLGETSVGEQQNFQEQGFAQQGNGTGSSGRDSVAGGDSAVVSPASEHTTLIADGRVDLYA